MYVGEYIKICWHQDKSDNTIIPITYVHAHNPNPGSLTAIQGTLCVTPQTMVARDSNNNRPQSNNIQSKTHHKSCLLRHNVKEEATLKNADDIPFWKTIMEKMLCWLSSRRTFTYSLVPLNYFSFS